MRVEFARGEKAEVVAIAAIFAGTVLHLQQPEREDDFDNAMN
ncbi:hypothetical protein [Kluyvera ascorbata]